MQKPNATAFFATGVATDGQEAIGEPYEDAAGRSRARLLGQPMLVFAAKSERLLRAYRVGGRMRPDAPSMSRRCSRPATMLRPTTPSSWSRPTHRTSSASRCVARNGRARSCQRGFAAPSGVAVWYDF
ncbi:MAG: DUF2000 family protein [Rhodospirillales bacterium]|nr:DUF2000 family protein [Rhodospirillales bacterium]